MEKLCARRNCKKPLDNKRRKYCNDSCRYWENLFKREDIKPAKGWGSKNSQVRLDRASRRFGAKLRRQRRSYFM